jgi:YjbE family integral membrane protein
MNRDALDTAIVLLVIMGINILLSADNTVVVGMTIRNLPPARRRIASAAGIGAAVLLQIAATLTLARLLELRVVLLIAGVLLCVIAIRLLRENADPQGRTITAHRNQDLPEAILAVAGGYFVMCIDNILGVAAVGRGHPWLLAAGILLSSAVVVPASLIVARLMRRFPATLTIGAAIVGWVAGSMLSEAAAPLTPVTTALFTQVFIPFATAAVVVTSPRWRHGWVSR